MVFEVPILTISNNNRLILYVHAGDSVNILHRKDWVRISLGQNRINEL